MATLLHDRPKERRSNPFGLTGDFEELFLIGFGVALSGGINDNLVGPLATSVVAGAAPGLVSGDAGQKVFDGATTWGTAMAEGYVGNALGFHRSSRIIEKAGKALAVAKWATILLPGYSLNGRLPGFIQIPQLGPGAPAKPGMTLLPSGQPVGTGTVAGPPARPAVAGSAPGQRPTGL